MGATTSLQKLTQLIQRYESDGGCVKRVEAETAEMQTETEMSVTLDLAVPLCSDDESNATTPTTATITGNGCLQVEFSSSVFPTLADYVSRETTVETDGTRIADDGTIVTTFIVGFGKETEAGHVVPGSAVPNSQVRSTDEPVQENQENGTMGCASSESTSAPVSTDDETAESNGVDRDLAADGTDASGDHQREIERKLAAARNDDLPPYDDTEYLQCLYDSLDTFTEMAEHIEMDVASETVRRYMTESGVHEPSTYNTTETDGDDAATDDAPAAEDLDDEPVDPIERVSDKPLVADGSGLPDDVDVEELADALESCMTLHQIQRQLELSRERTREVLNELDLIDLVMRRISHDPDQEVSREEIANRIRGSASGTR